MDYYSFEHSTKVILKVTFVVLVLAFLWVVRDILIIILLSIVFASAMDPLVDYLKQKRIPRAVSVLAVYTLVLGIIGLIVALVIPLVVQQSRLVFQNLPAYISTLTYRYPILNSIDLGSVANEFFGGGGQNGSVFNRTVGVFSGLFTFLPVLVISFYLVADDRGMKNFIRTLVPLHYRDITTTVVEKIQKKMGMWVLGQVILSVSIFVFTYLGLLVLGVKYALFLALIAGVLEVVPYIGPTLSAIPALFFAFVQSPSLAIGVLILYILIQKLEGWILVPKVMEKTIGTSPVVILLALLVGFKLAGVLGLLLSVPLVGAVLVILDEFFSGRKSTA